MDVRLAEKIMRGIATGMSQNVALGLQERQLGLQEERQKAELAHQAIREQRATEEQPLRMRFLRLQADVEAGRITEMDAARKWNNIIQERTQKTWQAEEPVLQAERTGRIAQAAAIPGTLAAKAEAETRAAKTGELALKASERAETQAIGKLAGERAGLQQWLSGLPDAERAIVEKGLAEGHPIDVVKQNVATYQALQLANAPTAIAMLRARKSLPEVEAVLNMRQPVVIPGSLRYTPEPETVTLTLVGETKPRMFDDVGLEAILQTIPPGPAIPAEAYARVRKTKREERQIERLEAAELQRQLLSLVGEQTKRLQILATAKTGLGKEEARTALAETTAQIAELKAQLAAIRKPQAKTEPPPAAPAGMAKFMEEQLLR